MASTSCSAASFQSTFFHLLGCDLSAAVMESRPLVDDELPDDGMDDVIASVPLPRRQITKDKFRGKDMYPTLQNLRRKKNLIVP